MTKFSELLLLETKRASVTTDGIFTAYVSTFGPPPDLVGDIIEKGAFRPALAAHRQTKTQPALLWNHNSDEPIGTWINFVEDDHGLLGTGRLTLQTRRGKEAAALMKDNALATSIGFGEVASTLRGSVRHITRISRLAEISLVSLPANPKAKIVSKARPTSRKQFEHLLRDVAGLTVREAKRVSFGGYGSLVRQEQDSTDLDAVLTEIRDLKNLLKRGN